MPAYSFPVIPRVVSVPCVPEAFALSTSLFIAILLQEVISKNPKHKKRKRAEEDTGDDLKVVEQPKRQRGKKVVPGIFGAAGLMSAEEAEKRAAEKKVLTNRGPVAEPEKPAEEPKEKKEKKPKKEKKNKKDKNAAKKAETEKKVEEPKEKKEKKEKMED